MPVTVDLIRSGLNEGLDMVMKKCSHNLLVGTYLFGQNATRNNWAVVVLNAQSSMDSSIKSHSYGLMEVPDLKRSAFWNSSMFGTTENLTGRNVPAKVSHVDVQALIARPNRADADVLEPPAQL